MSTWTLTYTPVGGPSVTQDFAAWGLKSLHRKLASFACDAVTFIADGRAIDADPLFVYGSTITIKKNGVGWFTGIVTQTPGSARPKREEQSYEVSGPWWYFENLIFQQEWYSWNGINSRLISTLKTMVIIGQNLDGTKMDLGKMMSTVLDYILVTAAAATTPFVPFQKGLMTPDTVIPFGEVTDKTCAQVIESCIQWIPDAVSWFDYTTTPPTFNVARRGDLPAVTLAAYGAPMSGLDLTPRHDLVVPAVIAKYDQTNTIDGTTYNSVTVDQYPPNAPDPAFRNLIQHIDLIGGNATFQHQDVVVQNLPVAPDGTATMPWVKAHIPWLFGSPSSPSIYDTDKITVTALLGKDLASDDPAVANPPTGFAVVNLTEELMSGAVTKWMTDTQNIFAASVIIPVQLSYSGSDPATLALFSGDPLAAPNTRIDYIKVKATNAQTQTYKQMTSLQQSEPIPVGVAQRLYDGLSVLHYQGEIEMTEQECGGAVGLNHVVNLSGGRPEWAVMNAAVFEIAENIDEGITQIRIGPNVVLNLEQWTEMLRAARGRLFSWHLQQRTTGQSGDGNAVIGHTHVPESSTSSPPAPSLPDDFPFQVSWRVNPADPSGNTFEALVNLDSCLYSSPSLHSNIAITGLNTWFPLLANDTIWLFADVSNFQVSGNPTIHSFGQGNSDYSQGAADWTTGGTVENDGGTPPTQTIFRRAIAISIADADGRPSFGARQYTQSHLAMQNTIFSGEAAIYPTPL